MNTQRIAVVGHCASGKSTLASGLRGRGFDAWAVAQEHSAIANLWRHQSPDTLIYLDVSLESIRERRDDPNWPGWLYDLQSGRLASAREHANLIVPTDSLSAGGVLSRVLAKFAV
ncbi:MAG TPA: hypothetical protein PK593_09765 [Thermomicrobiales bacterium]|jgi:hypothetical protein|nr:hypothetical protein [Chloroflexota bacterium]HCG28799.1 hypothetical protein [Chloroflexota bacterium]HQX63730.1 hypothetical protein [Thermomicrobiales bacterium]HQZ89607.1 hypothetical protein [Thermomicrobiales bacterium]HRA32081.1 hypothetical protein [Thermomicrobiales bacterium]